MRSTQHKWQMLIVVMLTVIAIRIVLNLGLIMTIMIVIVLQPINLMPTQQTALA